MKKLICTLLFCTGLSILQAQQLLQSNVSIEVKNMPLASVLEQMGRQGGFSFSYNSNIINGDSLVSVHMNKHTVKQVLDYLFKGTIQYQSSGRYIILHTALPPPTPSLWYLTGYISDAVSGEKIANASIYERQHLAGTISDEYGFFRLKLKDRHKYPAEVSISISRISYADTFVIVQNGQENQLSVSLLPVSSELTPVIVGRKNEKSWLSRLFVSSGQRIQSLNLRNFFADKPYQISFLPGLGTHGKLSGQVVNDFSFNFLGGYTAGSKGFEMAGLFNINRKEAKYVQLAGLFNVDGANAKGVQLAGVYNHVQDSVNGVQVAGVENRVKKGVDGVQVAGVSNRSSGKIEGVQVAGVVNHADSSVRGVQVAGIASRSARAFKGVQVSGIANTVSDSASGIQVSGIVNHVHKTINGTQITGIVNYARHVKGAQIGLINICDTLSGYSIGLINIVRKGYHKLTVETNDVLDVNLIYKAGNRHLYSMIGIGSDIGGRKNSCGIMYGLGNEMRLGKRLFLTNELLAQQIYQGTWDTIPILIRFKPALHFQLTRFATLYAGPVIWFGNPGTPAPGYKTITTNRSFIQSDNNKAWIGWSCGIQLF